LQYSSTQNQYPANLRVIAHQPVFLAFPATKSPHLKKAFSERRTSAIRF
jgi:hypothetical protein